MLYEVITKWVSGLFIPEIRPTMKTIYPLIEKRKSPFIFLDKMPDEADLNLLFSAASRAPSGFNRQPWRFMLALKGTEQYKLVITSYSIHYTKLYESDADHSTDRIYQHGGGKGAHPLFPPCP